MTWRWNPFSSRKAERAAAHTDGRLVYAIGDVHGCLGLLRRLVDSIYQDALDARPTVRPVLVLLGDYIDRGSQSRGVIDHINALIASGEFEVRALKGNHEEAMLDFLADPVKGPAWVAYGGAATLMSYGVNPPMMEAEPGEWEIARRALVEALPANHRQFLGALELKVSIGSYVFVHAGLRPGVAMEAQTERDMLWIREPFLSRADFDQTIVHGHTPARDPHLGAERIGVDTGAYATGVLTAARLNGADASVLQVSGEAA